VTTDGTTPARRGRPGYDLESLLQVVVVVFNERGYDGTSMEDLARTLGITKSAIYHHVAGKSELLRLALDRALDGLFAAAEAAEAEAAATGGRSVDALEHLVRASVAVLVERLPFVTLLLRVRGNTEVEREALARRRQFDRHVADLARRAVTEGDLRPDVDSVIIARLLFGMVNSLVEWLRPTGDLATEDLADAVCAVAFDGLRVRPIQAGDGTLIR
jgi:AcrR family transcriptional regulator